MKRRRKAPGKTGRPKAKPGQDTRRRRDLESVTCTVYVPEQQYARVVDLPRRVHLRAFQLGISLRELAARMGLSPQALSGRIHRHRMTVQRFIELSTALGMSAADWQAPAPAGLSPARLTAARLKMRRKLTEQALASSTRPVSKKG